MKTFIEFIMEENKLSFLSAIDEEPWQTDTYFVYADWLEDQGKDMESRFVRELGRFHLAQSPEQANASKTALTIAWRDHSDILSRLGLFLPKFLEQTENDISYLECSVCDNFSVILYNPSANSNGWTLEVDGENINFNLENNDLGFLTCSVDIGNINEISEIKFYMKCENKRFYHVREYYVSRVPISRNPEHGYTGVRIILRTPYYGDQSE